MAHELQRTNWTERKWVEKLSHFNFSIIHRKGSAHANADARSRPTQCNYTKLIDNTRNIKEKQDKDPDIYLMKQWINEDNFANKIPKDSSCQSSILWNLRSSMFINDGVLYRRSKNIDG